MKFSIIVPVYNVEKYIERCLTSLMKQTYKEFEVIVVDDGSKDKSIDIAEQFVLKDKRFRIVHKQNGGLSDARNFGVPFAEGDYLLFIDSDDFIEIDLLRKIHDAVEDTNTSIDVVRYALRMVDEAGKPIETFVSVNQTGMIKFQECLNEKFLEPAWLYAYRTAFWKQYWFEYPKGKLHEDFGLTPLVLLLASSIYNISYIGLNYVQRAGSIMSTNDYQKDLKKVDDIFYHYHHLMELAEKEAIQNNEQYRYFKSFLVNGVILKIQTLHKEDQVRYFAEMKKYGMSEYLLTDTWKRKIKKIYMKLKLKI